MSGPTSDAGLRRRWRRGWYAYDWASSTFPTTVVGVYLGPYLTDLARRSAGPDGMVSVLGLHLRPGSVFPLAVALSVLLTALVLPPVGAWVDLTGRGVVALGAAAAVGATATVGLGAVTAGAWTTAIPLLVVGGVALTSGYAVYNAFLPRIATPAETDQVSSRGWAVGYVGAAALLGVNLLVDANREGLGLSADGAVRVNLLLAGLWWGAFTVVTLLALRSVPWPATRRQGNPVRVGAARLRRTVRGARAHPAAVRFLLAFLVYNQGVQAVVTVAVLYAVEEIDLDRRQLWPAALALQVLALVGTLAFARLARRAGARHTVLGMLVVLAVVSVATALVPRGNAPALFLAVSAGGLVVGAVQALSRSMFARQVPPGEEAEWFGLYQFGERGTAWAGPLVFGLVYQLTGSYRVGMAALAGAFVTGFVLLAAVRLDAASERPRGGPTPPLGLSP